MIIDAPFSYQILAPTSWVPAANGQYRYDTADPYAVRIVFAGATWQIGRDLLQAGLLAPTGVGDIRVWPTVAVTDAIFVNLRSPSGEALIEVSRRALTAFLERTAALVPYGQESLADMHAKIAGHLTTEAGA